MKSFISSSYLVAYAISYVSTYLLFKLLYKTRLVKNSSMQVFLTFLLNRKGQDLFNLNLKNRIIRYNHSHLYEHSYILLLYTNLHHVRLRSALGLDFRFLFLCHNNSFNLMLRPSEKHMCSSLLPPD